MTARICLLGDPDLEIDGEPRTLSGHKTWALLAYLLLGSRTGRREIAELLDRRHPATLSGWHGAAPMADLAARLQGFERQTLRQTP